MAIDTQNKRRSVPQHVVSMVMVVPSGTIGTIARETATWLYNGITPFTPIVGGPVQLTGDLYWHRSDNP